MPARVRDCSPTISSARTYILSAVAANAKKDDPCPYARKALLYHYKYLARNSQNLAIALNARGVFWAGDNHVSNRAFVHKYVRAVVSLCRRVAGISLLEQALVRD